MNAKKVTASGNATLTGQYRITRVRLVAGDAATTVILYDAITQAGPEIVKLSASAANTVDKENWAAIKGIMTSAGISVTLNQGAGSGAALYIYYA